MATNLYLTGSMLAAIAAAAVPDTITNNGDNTFTYTDSAGGTPFTWAGGDVVTDNGDGTFTVTPASGAAPFTFNHDIDNETVRASNAFTAGDLMAIGGQGTADDETVDPDAYMADLLSNGPAASAVLAAATDVDAVPDRISSAWAAGDTLRVGGQGPSADEEVMVASYLASAMANPASGLQHTDAEVDAATATGRFFDAEQHREYHDNFASDSGAGSMANSAGWQNIANVQLTSRRANSKFLVTYSVRNSGISNAGGGACGFYYRLSCLQSLSPQIMYNNGSSGGTISGNLAFSQAYISRSTQPAGTVHNFQLNMAVGNMASVGAAPVYNIEVTEI